MRLVTGQAGSGKTTYILQHLRAALRTGSSACRLLVPTATMAAHLRNLLAREGFVFSPSLIQTFSGFVETWAADLPQVSEPALNLIVEEAARRVNRPEFASVVGMHGFYASLASTILEFSSAGCDGRRLAAHLPTAPVADAFLSVYCEVDRRLAERGLAMRGRRLEIAAERITSKGLGGISTVWLDGFHALPDPELAVIRAMTAHAEVVLTRTEGEEQSQFASWPVTRFARSRPAPAVLLFKAPGLEREAEEIARRILEQTSAGHQFRDIGIIVRNGDKYVPLLRATFERFGIPSRFYFDGHLEEHAAVRFLCGAIHAMLSGWEHTKTLAVLRLAPRFATSSAMDRFDFAVREQIPNSGLGPLKSLLVDDGGKPHSSGAERLLHKLESLGALDEWRHFALTPHDWAARFRTLRNLFRVELPAAHADRATVELHRSQAAALNHFDEALDSTASALDPHRAIAIADFLRPLESVLRISPLRFSDDRRNVVNVLSAHEARQWVLPIVFVCGMVEKEFPSFHTQNPYFPDSARVELNQAGIRVRTASEFEREERALFDSAITRATSQVTISYPEFNARGDRNLPSIYLEHLLIEAADSRSVKPRPRHPLPPRPPAALHAPAILEELGRRTTSMSPSGLELYLQCAFQYYGGRLLRLKRPPLRPTKRLDFMTQGSIVHDVLKRWWSERSDIEALFDEVFAAALDEKHIPCVYHTERLRNAMLDDLHDFASGDTWPRAMFQSRTEEQFEFAVGDVVMRGRIDRLDVTGDRAYVIDYKYSNGKNTKAKLSNADLVQAPVYLMAAERVFGFKPAGMFYVGLKRGPQYAGWSEGGFMDGKPLEDNWLPNTERRILEIVQEIRNGRIEVSPSDPDKCRFCDYRDACRVQVQTAEPEAEEVEPA